MAYKGKTSALALTRRQKSEKSLLEARAFDTFVGPSVGEMNSWPHGTHYLALLSFRFHRTKKVRLRRCFFPLNLFLFMTS